MKEKIKKQGILKYASNWIDLSDQEAKAIVSGKSWGLESDSNSSFGV